jgi:uncharacterized membrane protein
MILRTLLLLTVCLLTATSAYGKDYIIRSVETEMVIERDGTVSVTEYRRYTFDGSFSWADYRLNTNEFGDISDLTIHELNEDYVKNASEEPGSYQINREDDIIQLKWFFDATNTTRTFIISYSLSDVVTTGMNWAEFDWHYLSDDWGKTTEYFTALVSFEEDITVSSNSLYAWLYSNSQAQVDTGNGTLSIVAERVSKRHEIRVRFLFPKSAIPEAQVTDVDFTKEQVLNEEQVRAVEMQREQELQEQRKAFADIAIPVVSVVSIVLFIFFFRTYRPKDTGEHVELKPASDGFPTQYKPAIIARLVHGGYTGGNVVMSTLLDLSRRGVVTLKHTGKEKKVFSEVDMIEITIEEPVEIPLEDFEHSLLEFMQRRMDDEKASDLYSIFNGKTMQVHSWKTKWAKQIRDQVERLNWYDEKSKKGAIYNAIFQSLLVICAIILLFWSLPYGLFALFTTTFAALGSLGIYARTPKGKAVFEAWKEVKKNLNKEPELSATIYEPMGVLVHGVNLGINEAKLKKVISAYGMEKQEVFNKVLEITSSYSNDEEWLTTLMVSSYGATVMPIAGSGSAAAGGAGAGASGGAAGGAG